MPGITFNILNIKEVSDKIKTITDKAFFAVKDEVASAALNIQSNAKRNAPIDFGTLRGSIYQDNISKDRKFIYVIGSKLKYAPYVEFGTGGLVSVPSEYTDYAMLFKGTKGRKINMRAQPYLIPAFESEKAKLITNLKKLLNNA